MWLTVDTFSAVGPHRTTAEATPSSLAHLALTSIGHGLQSSLGKWLCDVARDSRLMLHHVDCTPLDLKILGQWDLGILVGCHLTNHGMAMPCPRKEHLTINSCFFYKWWSSALRIS